MLSTWVRSLVGKIPWRIEQLPTPVFWPGEFHWLYSPWGHKELDTTEFYTFTVLVRNAACQCRRYGRHGFDPWVRKIPQNMKWHPIPVFLPGNFHGQMGLAGHSPWGYKESDTSERTCMPTNCTGSWGSVLWRKTVVCDLKGQGAWVRQMTLPGGLRCERILSIDKLTKRTSDTLAQ